MQAAAVRAGSAPPNPGLTIALLGDPIVSYDGETCREIQLTSRCVLLLAALLLHRKTRLRERIAATLWPDTLDCEARANLRRTLHDLVRALPETTEPWVHSDAKRILWNPLAPVWCDVDAFERLAAHDETRAAAVDLYGGEFLEGEDADWVVELRGRLRERQIESLGMLADAHLGRGDTLRAAEYYRRLLALDPFREDAFRSLLGLRYVRGDRARAACEYRGFVTRLNSELGVDPMPETVACYERVVRGEPYAHRVLLGAANA